jgi:hypothetical protein
MLYYLPVVIGLSIIASLLTGYIAAVTIKNTRHIKV